MFFTFRSYAHYLIKGKTKYYIHSPFVFSFINKVLHDRREFYSFNTIEKLRQRLLQDNSVISYEDMGAGPKTSSLSGRKINAIATSSSIPRKYGQLLSHIVDHFQSTKIIELGTCLGIGTAYLASPNLKATVFTLEGSEPLAQLATKNFNGLDLNNVKLIKGDFLETLPLALSELNNVDLAFIDGNHRYEPTMSYFNQILTKTHTNSIIILDDIHWSAEMEQAWTEICNHPRVTVTIDLFRLGIVFFRTEQAKENFVLYF